MTSRLDFRHETISSLVLARNAKFVIDIPPRTSSKNSDHRGIAPPSSKNIAPTAMATATEISPPCKVVLAATIAKSLLVEIKDGFSNLQKPPMLVGFLANDDPAAQMYADWTGKTCREK